MMKLYGYEVDEKVRLGFIESLPLVNEIKDEVLRNKVIDAWSIALTVGGFKKLEEVPGVPAMDYACNQVRHTYLVARMCQALVKCYDENLDPRFNFTSKIDPDLLLIAAICHDIGNPYEHSFVNQARWKENPNAEGQPCMRHPIYGAYLCLLVGLPEVIANVCATHAAEGGVMNLKRSLLATILAAADDVAWRILKSAENKYI
jgi:hypothetical protein